MNPPPVTLRVKSPDDLRGQLAMIRANALAESLHRDLMVPRVSVPQTIPHATPKGDTSGSDVAARLAVCHEQLHAARIAYERAGTDWEAADKMGRTVDRLEAQRARLNADLASIPTRSSARRSGRPGLYLIRVPAIEYAGRMGQGGMAGEAWVLDTHSLPDGLREALTAYLLSGAEMMPYWQCGTRTRYYARNTCPADVRALLGTLCGYLTLTGA